MSLKKRKKIFFFLKDENENKKYKKYKNTFKMSEYSSVLNVLNRKSTNTVFTVINFSKQKKYEIDYSNVINFYKSYCDSLYIKDLENWNIHPVFMLGEVTSDSIPIIGEFLFKFDITPDEDIKDMVFYDKNFLLEMVKIFQETMKELFFLSSTKSEMICVILETPNWKEGDKILTKIKLQFPYCKTNRKFANNVFRNKVIQKLRHYKLNQLFSKSSPVGDWETQYEDIKNYYPLYGSTESNKKPPYYFAGVFSDKQEEVSLEKSYVYSNHQYISGEKCIPDQVETLEDSDMTTEDHKIYLLPMFLSLDFCSGITQIKEQFTSTGSNISGSAIHSEDDDDDFNENPSEITMCNQLVELLDEKRFTMENYFLDIGKAYHKSVEGENFGFESWYRIVQEKNLDYSREYCEEKWETFDNEEITVKTLAWYANIDSPEDYQNWHDNWCRPKLIQASRSAKHIKVAEAFYRSFWLRYMYTGKRWIEFRRSKLVILSEDFTIRRTITEDFIPLFDDLRHQLSEDLLKLNKIGRSTQGEKVKDIRTQMTEVEKLIDKLQMENYRNYLVKSFKEYFFKENLSKILNKHPSLLGCGNCVIELTDKHAFARDGKPEDYITKKVGVNYKSHYTMKHPDVQDLLKYFEQVFPEKSINHHMRKDIGSMLYGRNAEKYFRMWIGDTNGSKSVYQKMINEMLGVYYCDLPATYFSADQRGGSGPNPELAQTEGARVAFSAEPDDDTSFKGARIKRLTGGDSFYARSCNEDGGSIQTSFKNIMVLNLVPDITGMDEATKNRFCMVPFEGRWIRKDEDFVVPETHEDQVKAKTYWMDERFEDNIPKLASALLWLAVRYYEVYRKEGLTAPKYIKDWMTDYWTKHDPHVSFITEMLENPKIKIECADCKNHELDCKKCNNSRLITVTNMEKYITATDIFPIYKKWWRETYQDKSVNKSRMIEILSTPDKLGKQEKKRWYGVVVRRQNPVEISDF